MPELESIAGLPNVVSVQIDAPSGWQLEKVGTKTVFTPPDLQEGDFLDGFADRDIAALSKPTGAAKPASSKTPFVASAIRTLVTEAGATRYAVDGRITSRIRLYLYASGECRLCNEKGEDYQHGTDTYARSSSRAQRWH